MARNASAPDNHRSMAPHMFPEALNGFTSVPGTIWLWAFVRSPMERCEVANPSALVAYMWQ